MASCIDKYTTLLDLSRQSEILTGETACLSGKIYAGIPFSAYPSGVDPSTSAITSTSSASSVFSGNNLTTLFDVSNPTGPNFLPLFSSYSDDIWTGSTGLLLMSNTSGLTLPITPNNAGDDQTVGPFWAVTETGFTGSHIIDTKYSGYSITYSWFIVDGVHSGSTSIYSGVTGFTAGVILYLSAGTLDYKGPLDYLSSAEDITASGTVITKNLRVYGGASASTIGYVINSS